MKRSNEQLSKCSIKHQKDDSKLGEIGTRFGGLVILMRLVIGIFLLSGWLFGGASLSHASEPITLVSYYLEPPYELGNGKGLTHELAAYLNQRADGRLHFEAKALPRKRLDRQIEKGESLIIPWANPDWFPKLTGGDHRWSSPYIQGASMVIANASDKREFRSPESLKGCILTGVVGFYYPGLDELVAKNEIERRDFLTYGEVFRIISARPGNCTMASTITTKYLIRAMALERKVRILDDDFDTFSRRFLLVNQPSHVQDFLNETAEVMAQDGEWLKVLNRYGLRDLADQKLAKN